MKNKVKPKYSDPSIFEYRKIDSGIEITDVKSKRANIVIPPKIDGIPVTNIGIAAFSYDKHLKTIIIPNSVLNIGERAFAYCTNLTNIIIPNSVMTIQQEAFASCENLKNVIIPESVVNIGDFVFMYCDNLQNIEVNPSNSKYCSDEYGVLYNKDKSELIQYPIGNTRTSFTIPNNVTIIRSKAFYWTKNLQVLTIANSVTSIGDCTFNDCSNLTNVTIGSRVKQLSAKTFAHCDLLTTINVSSHNPYYSNDENGVLYNKNKTNLILYPCKNDRTSFSVPDSVTTIEAYAFSNCHNLKSIIISDSVITIEAFAFHFCNKLSNILIGNNVNQIDHHAFECFNVKSVTIPNSVVRFGMVPFPDNISTTGTGIYKAFKLTEDDRMYYQYHDDDPKQFFALGEKTSFGKDRRNAILYDTNLFSIFKIHSGIFNKGIREYDKDFCVCECKVDGQLFDNGRAETLTPIKRLTHKEFIELLNHRN